MRIRSVLTTLLVALMLVVGADYVALAAGGSSFLLGKKNTSAKQTTLVRTGNGAALKLKTKPGAPPLKVTSRKKVKKLNADQLDGLDADAFASTVTAIEAVGCRSRATVGETPALVTTIGTFTKSRPETSVRLDFSTVFYVQSLGGITSTGVVYELRIDGERTTLGSASTLVGFEETYVGGDITGVFPDLGRGEHTVEVWVRVVGSLSPSASGAQVNAGCFTPDPKTSTVYVTESL